MQWNFEIVTHPNNFSQHTPMERFSPTCPYLDYAILFTKIAHNSS